MSTMTRKDFLTTASVSALGAAALGALGSLYGLNAELAVAQEAAKPAEFTDGKYTIETIGHEGRMVVVTTIRNGSISSVDVPSYRETQGVGTYAIKTIPGRIVAAQSINVDAVAGATITSNVIMLAVAQAIEAAGGDPDDFDIEPPEPEVENLLVPMDVKYAIMGAGTAGLFAASWLLKNGVDGADIVLFEKTGIPGGCFPMTYGGLACIGSQVYKNWGFGPSYYNDWEAMRPMQDAVVAGYTSYLTEVNHEYPYIKQMYLKCGELMDWMVSIGIGFCTLGMTSSYAGEPFFAPGAYCGGTGFAMEALVKRMEAAGVRVFYETPVTGLIMDGDAVVGLKAQGKNGAAYQVKADAVLLASGSFAKNSELLHQYYDADRADQYFNCPETEEGDGLLLGLEAGGVAEHMNEFLPGYCCSYATKQEISLIHYSTPGIYVNAYGDTFGNTGSGHQTVMAAARMNPANGGAFYLIFDDAAAAQTRDYKAYNYTKYNCIFEKGEAVRYDSLAAAAEALDLPNLVATVEQNNAWSLAGEADQWGRKNLPYIETRDGVWVLRVDPVLYLTTGGLAVDLGARVLNAAGEPIRGLFAAGDVCGSIEHKDGKHYGYGCASAMSYGAVAAESMIAG